MKILVLEDNQERQEKFKQLFRNQELFLMIMLKMPFIFV